MAKRKLDMFINAYDRATGPMRKVGRGLGGLMRSATSLKGALAGALAGFAIQRSVAATVGAYREQIEAEMKLAAVLRATGNAAGFTADELKKRASALQAATTFEDHAILNAQAMLASFVEIQGTTFTEATQTMLDMSTLMDQDLKTSAIQLGKALNDPIQGVAALSRVGVSFTQDQKDMIKSLVEMGDTVGAQTMILRLMREQGIDKTAQALAATSTGAITQAKNAFGDLTEQIGGKLSPVIAAFARLFTQNFDRIAAYTMTWVNWIVDAFTNNVIPIFLEMGFVWNNFGDIVDHAMYSAGLSVLTFVNELEHLFTVKIPTVLVWLFDNWRDIFLDISTMAVTILDNISLNLINVWDNLPGLMAGTTEWGEIFVPLTQGFETAIKTLPEVARREMGKVEKQMANAVAALEAKLGKKYVAEVLNPTGVVAGLDFTNRDGDADVINALIPREDEDAGADAVVGSGGKETAGTTGAVGVSGGFTGLGAQFSQQRRHAQKTADNTEKTAKAVEKLVDIAEAGSEPNSGGGGKIRVVNLI